MLNQLPLFINITIIENNLDYIEVIHNTGSDVDIEDEGELLYLIKCLEDDIPYKSFFDEIDLSDHPFEFE